MWGGWGGCDFLAKTFRSKNIGMPQVHMQSLFAKNHAINFQNEGRHAMEQSQAVNEGDAVDDGFLVCNMTFRKRSRHYKNFASSWLVNASQQEVLKLVAIPV